MAAEGADGVKISAVTPSNDHHVDFAMDDGDAGDTCRICRGEATNEQPLFFPCKCSGSIRYVHQECLMEWLSHSQKKYCELCKTSFRFTKLYDSAMPDFLPIPLFAKQILLHGLRTLGTYLRYVFVTTVWTCLLPWCVRHIWRGLFWLADGSWMSEQDLYHLVTTNIPQPSPDMATNATIGIHTPARRQNNPSEASSSVASVMWGLLNSDALLRGLLRLATYNPFTLTSISGSQGEVHLAQHPASSASPHSLRQRSLLADVQILKTFTKYTSVNHGLIDVLEGQLICLSVIAAFILVFLIREWVINQQPIHLMPDPDQAPEAPTDQIQQEEDPGQLARRRRHNVRALRDQIVQQEGREMDVAQRPRAVLRPRRIAAGADNASPPERAGMDSTSTISSESSTTVSDSQALQGVSLLDDPTPEPGRAETEPPPLHRGLFDAAADIRRSIEERAVIPPQLEDTIAAPLTTVSSREHAVERLRQIDNPAAPLDLGTFSAFEHSGEFTFGIEPGVTAATASTEDTSEIFEMLSALGPDTPSSMISSGAVSDTESVSQTVPLASEHAARDTEEVSTVDTAVATSSTDENDQVPEADDVPQTIAERMVRWLWHTDQVANVAITDFPDDVVDPGVALDVEPAALPGHGAEAVNAMALRPVQPAAAPPREPNIQFGIDLNDPNAVDDAEDLEGLLELIGMEGPIAGMLQNIVFSVFLITLTLSASVWCPYIWGKIALLVMSNPVGIFLKAPLYFVSKVADILVDLMLLCSGVLGFVLTSVVRTAKSVLTLVLPKLGRYIRVNAIESLAVSMTQTSSVRLEKALSITVFHLRPDLPTFSMQSHHALRIFKAAASDIVSALSGDVQDSLENFNSVMRDKPALSVPFAILQEVASFPAAAAMSATKSYGWLCQVSQELRTPVVSDSNSFDISLIEWSNKDKILTILIGYTFFALAGIAYLRLARLVLGLKEGEEVQGAFADSLRQAGGVMKVIVIIGIEMIIFPLYCGCLLDIALLPLFRGATIQTRLAFIAHAPLTGLFIHWFIGTCYMFHFALFVSMCRKIMRRGVLYFIRDPDDPTFHPVRDVLERPVATQLSKIAFSACVYGGLVIVCLGGVVWSLGRFDGVFPIQWATEEPGLAFPADLIFFNFVLPFIIRRIELSKKVSTIYGWWFQKCAKKLRLSHFLMGKDLVEERTNSSHQLSRSTSVDTASEGVRVIPGSQKPFEGSWVRAPASDSVRIPRGTRTFVEVSEDNTRLDGEPDREKGLHGKSDGRFAKIYIPPRFQLRIAAFIFLVWLFAASTGAILGIVPLLLGRSAIKLAARTEIPPNDLYAFTLGAHACAIVSLMGISVSRYRLRSGTEEPLLRLGAVAVRCYNRLKYFVGLLYLSITLGFVLPILLSLVAELYIHMPLYNAFVDTKLMEEQPRPTPETSAMPTIYVVQSWTLGILYLRLLVRLIFRNLDVQSRPATAIRSIIRNGVLHPDVQLASRAFILPVGVMSSLLLALPPTLARVWIAIARVHDHSSRLITYRSSYPVLLATGLTIYSLIMLRNKIGGWQTRVRDDVYLVGERLHNFSDSGAKKKDDKKSQTNVISLSGVTDIRSEADSENVVVEEHFGRPDNDHRGREAS